MRICLSVFMRSDKTNGFMLLQYKLDWGECQLMCAVKLPNCDCGSTEPVEVNIVIVYRLSVASHSQRNISKHNSVLLIGPSRLFIGGLYKPFYQATSMNQNNSTATLSLFVRKLSYVQYNTQIKFIFCLSPEWCLLHFVNISFARAFDMAAVTGLSVDTDLRAWHFYFPYWIVLVRSIDKRWKITTWKTAAPGKRLIIALCDWMNFIYSNKLFKIYSINHWILLIAV